MESLKKVFSLNLNGECSFNEANRQSADKKNQANNQQQPNYIKLIKHQLKMKRWLTQLCLCISESQCVYVSWAYQFCHINE